MWQETMFGPEDPELDCMLRKSLDLMESEDVTERERHFLARCLKQYSNKKPITTPQRNWLVDICEKYDLDN